MFGRGPGETRVPLKKEEIWLGIVLIAAVTSFLGGSAFVERRSGRQTAASRRESNSELSCVVEVCHVEEDLQELEADLEPPKVSLPDASARVLAVLDRVDGRLRGALDHAHSGREQALWATVGEEVTKLRAEILRLLGAGPADGAQRARAVFYSDALATDATLGSLADFERERAGQTEDEGDASRASTRGIMYGLDGLILVVLSVLTVHAMGAHRKHRRMLEGRLDELQMFAVRLAHDIRGPLTPATLALERIAKITPEDDPSRGLVRRSIRSLRTIDHLVEALFAFASAGAAPERTESAPVDEVIDTVVAQNQDTSAELGIDVKVESPGGLHVACSEGVLASVLGNLVSNALKHMGDCKERRVVVRVRARGRRVCMEVQDSGPGLPAGASERIFDPYVRRDTRTRGLGLGLATAKRLVVAHGGSIGVQKASPCGSIFWVDLPASPDAPAR